MGLWTRLRQNLSLKIVSLVAAILLYIFVQQERNPTVTRTLFANVELKTCRRISGRNGDAAHHRQRNRTSAKCGAIKDGDIKAAADVGSVTSKRPGSSVRLSYELPKSMPDIILDSAPEFTKIQVFRQKTRKLGAYGHLQERCARRAENMARPLSGQHG